jgi:hypothetical protein
MKARLFNALGRLLGKRDQEPTWARGLVQTTQLQLMWSYRRLLAEQTPLPRLEDVEFRAFSQSGEDGILLYLFALLGATTKRAIELAAGDGVECNTANLIVNHGWQALLVDSELALVERGRAFYRAHRSTWIWPPRFVHARLSVENVDALIVEQGFAGDVDLLSLDLDGMDYWIWQALRSARPRVVVVEYQTAWGPDERKVTAYDANFSLKRTAAGLCYGAGASLAALVALGRQKGYRLIGSQRYGFNAFFMRDDVGEGLFHEVSVASCFGHPHAQRILREDRGVLDTYEWITV